MTTSISVRHNFETAHRLPFLGGKCTNLHGHSWWAEVEIAGQPDADGVLLDFGTVKRHLREWIDGHLDHGAMLGHQDPLVEALQAMGSKVHVFDPATPGFHRGVGDDRPLHWPTVENVAELIRRVTLGLLRTQFPGQSCEVSVRVTETHVNAATATGTPS